MNSGERVTFTKSLMLLPMLIILAMFFISVFTLFSSAFVDRGGFSLKYFQQIIDRPDYHVVFYRTVLSSITVAILAVLFSYPIALLLWRANKWRNLLLIVVLVPWLVSLVVRTYGWIVLLGPKGFINAFLGWLGVVDEPVKLMFNDTGIIIGLTHVLVPFAVISILSSLLSIEENLEEASRVLGASGFQTFRNIVLPLSLPGVFTALMVLYLASVGAIVTPLLLGGITEKFVGSQIYQEVMATYNMSKAAAWSICLLSLSFVSLVIIKLIERRALRGQE
ncbi:ABC transporter permease [Sulfitobacter pseudonitzschiae]|uniref:ABC transporter permease n=1 Tax=Pseudosulfitobacter pseudonitzschiae TaxID=1402135 RepID=A0A9Q2RWY5_9RHOB|nr:MULTISPECIES: ABC transporter permease [Roseobacteraceae]MBM2293920.1 ABC transporter permease [Pseudosulfitobacter pseudonitzschiae]MBM2298837.1 ABC transporter permease [Pseudosulfitobacter pseudonitzschiae]MBM2303751.1 ABC transporter permease [Pseudosulfitobacter pseudonitzschiae]MBM2313534.1 ABC transporter permease [Pseudosulfitobacter pseudonitzschiae]MBM2318448.1 ABC transporter permease [Pseudosulfitobacter pseudonitzschiae]|tara:strand:- start:1035 stop:1871 length:837 start_codon:yes stop_codon:yes gene_type:complete